MRSDVSLSGNKTIRSPGTSAASEARVGVGNPHEPILAEPSNVEDLN
jgi:hypothetical protein